ncbi:MAG: carbohydrate-binding protein [Acidobacteriota bacterium]|nr:carbohydrate-binding protein [Acidobacteriota bacterium]
MGAISANVRSKGVSNQVSKQTFGHNQYNNQTDIRTYDFGQGAPGALVGHTHTDYLTSGYDSHNGPHIRNLPTTTTVHNAVGTVVAQSETRYDEPAYAPLTYGGVTGWVDPGTAARGLATTSRRWVDTTGGWLETHAQYDQLGNVRNTWDARGNLSQVEYSSAYHYAYPTRSISPVPDPAGTYGSNTALVTTSAYDFSTGLVTSAIDANNQTTTFNYDDPLNRLKVVNRPGGGWTQYHYDRDNNAGIEMDYVHTLTALDTSRSVSHYQFFDGLGRPVRSFRQAGAGQWQTADVQYDALGRAWRASNSYLSSGFNSPIPTPGTWTTTTYDALGRVKAVTTPDTAQVTTNYSGNQVTVTDQAGNQRRSTSDALGRLMSVTEAPNVGSCQPDGAGCTTDYAYDVLGNLRMVEQGGQRRYFMYDSLSRLIRAKNPEQAAGSAASNITDAVTGNNQWSMAYGYDAAGNLTSRVDARNVTSTYAYDNLNRNTTVRYSDTTPGINRLYDSATNGRGRFRANWTLSNAGIYETHYAIDNYDAAGRPLDSRQYFYVNNVAGAAFSLQRTYDLAGNVLTQTYPSGRTVTYSYDAAGRPDAFTGNLGDGVTRTYSTALQYDEASRLSRERFGTDTPLYHKRHYNVRGQLFDARLSEANDEWSGERGALANYYTTQGGHGASGTDNNGNVRWSEHIINASLTQDRYEYDSLNRLSSVAEYQNGATQSFAQVYSYDRFGNRTINAGATWGIGVNNTSFSVDASTNRLGVPGGQPGTMSYDTVGNLTLDTYTGQGTRAFDAENQMTSAQDAFAQTSGYSYDADGRRVRRTTGGATVWQVYGMDGELTAEYAASAAPTSPKKEYGYRAGELLIVAAGGGGSGDPSQTPYLGSPRAVPGTIEVEHFDDGGEGIAYHDNSPGNANGATYRSPTDVDVWDGGIGYVYAGEWLEYTINVGASGTYTVEVSVAAPGGGGVFHIEVGGVDKTGAMVVPATGG